MQCVKLQQTPLPMQVLAEVAARTAEAEGADPGYLRRRLTEQNAAAVALHKAGDHVGALAAYALLFRRQRSQNLAHAELHVCYACDAQPLLLCDHGAGSVLCVRNSYKPNIANLVANSSKMSAVHILALPLSPLHTQFGKPASAGQKKRDLWRVLLQC